jgi:hypothetical protein
MIRTFAESLAIFSVSVVALFLFYAVLSRIARVATGPPALWAWVYGKGLVLMGVGVLYLVAGFILTRVHR